MKIHEYQAKDILAHYKVPVPRGEVAFSAEEAVAAPRLHEQATPDVVLIEEKMPQTTRDALEQMRYKLRVIPQLGAVNAITIAPDNLHGAFDPRKGGGAAGY